MKLTIDIQFFEASPEFLIERIVGVCEEFAEGAYMNVCLRKTRALNGRDMTIKVWEEFPESDEPFTGEK
jgi:hypothetical protein